MGDFEGFVDVEGLGGLGHREDDREVSEKVDDVGRVIFAGPELFDDCEESGVNLLCVDFLHCGAP